MDEQAILAMIEELGKILPKFDDGRVNYKDSATAPVITVFVEYENKLLLLKRSNKVGTYKGKWGTVAGYLDEIKPVEEKVREELEEEIGVTDIESIKFGEFYKVEDYDIKRTWFVQPVLVKLKSSDIKLDWEHTEFKWINKEEMKDYDLVFGLLKTLEKVI